MLGERVERSKRRWGWPGNSGIYIWVRYQSKSKAVINSTGQSLPHYHSARESDSRLALVSRHLRRNGEKKKRRKKKKTRPGHETSRVQRLRPTARPDLLGRQLHRVGEENQRG